MYVQSQILSPAGLGQHVVNLSSDEWQLTSSLVHRIRQTLAPVAAKAPSTPRQYTIWNTSGMEGKECAVLVQIVCNNDPFKGLHLEKASVGAAPVMSCLDPLAGRDC